MNAIDELKDVGSVLAVRIHSSVKRARGKTYRQHCVRWWEAGERKQKCFGQLADAEKYRDQILDEQAKERARLDALAQVPDGWAMAFEQAKVQILAGDDGTFAIRSHGGAPRRVPLSKAFALFYRWSLNDSDSTSGDDAGMTRFFDAIHAALRRLEKVEKAGA